jgi:hypothetical protein
MRTVVQTYTDGQTNMMKLVVPFANSANVPNISDYFNCVFLLACSVQLKIRPFDIKTFKPYWWLYAPAGLSVKNFAFCRRIFFCIVYDSHGKQQRLYKALTYWFYDRVHMSLQLGTTWILKRTALSIFVFKMFCTSSVVSLCYCIPLWKICRSEKLFYI